MNVENQTRAIIGGEYVNAAMEKRRLQTKLGWEDFGDRMENDVEVPTTSAEHHLEKPKQRGWTAALQLDAKWSRFMSIRPSISHVVTFYKKQRQSSSELKHNDDPIFGGSLHLADMAFTEPSDENTT